MSAGRLWFGLWNWEPSVLIGCVALTAAYLFVVRGTDHWRAGLFLLGVGLLVWTLIGPLDVLGDTYLFSAHMAQHLLLILVVPLFLLLGVSPMNVDRLLRWSPAGRIEVILSYPVLAWTVPSATMWVWHLPVLYEATLRDTPTHIVEHISFLVTATIFWWPVLCHRSKLWQSPLLALGYLMAAAVSSSLLGMLLAFAAPGLYPSYLHPRDPLNILRMLQVGWGLTPDADQQLAGMLMWVVGSLVYLVAMMVVIVQWFTGEGHWTGSPGTVHGT
ncbi:MAG: hypothetical protein NVS2B7_14630 [Herpetosiphon sp.]